MASSESESNESLVMTDDFRFFSLTLLHCNTIINFH